MNLTSLEPKIFVLDATAFIGLDFPKLQSITDATFFTTSNVVSELKDFRSRTNLDILKHTGRLKFNTPRKKLLHEVKKQIEVIDPQTTLSSVDIDVLALTLQMKGTLISNDLRLQNAAMHFDIPVKVVSGKKISFPRKWQLKCASCGKIFEESVQTCTFCGGILKKVLKGYSNQDQKRRNKNKKLP